MTVTTFDTLKYANTLKAAGVPDKQAEAQAAVLADALAINLKDLVTKDDLKQSIDLLRSDVNGQISSLRTDMNGQISALRSDMNGQFSSLRSDMNGQIASLRSDVYGQIALLKWMIGALFPLLIGILVRLFFFRTP